MHQTIQNGFKSFLKNNYSHLSNNRGGWNKRVGLQKLQNQLEFFYQFLS